MFNRSEARLLAQKVPSLSPIAQIKLSVRIRLFEWRKVAREFRDVIAIGSSAGGIEALTALFSTLPRNLPAAMLVVQHSSPSSPGFLPEILTQAGALPVNAARNGQAVQQGSVYVAPPDHHLFVKKNRLQVTRGPRENNWRPSVDVLFRSVAAEYRSRAVGVVLSGLLYDGAAGLQWIRQSGGLAIVQSPDECQYAEMPLNALARARWTTACPSLKLAIC